jgi:hypothetical protein
MQAEFWAGNSRDGSASAERMSRRAKERILHLKPIAPSCIFRTYELFQAQSTGNKITDSHKTVLSFLSVLDEV